MAIDAKQDIQSARIPFVGNFLTRITQNPTAYTSISDYSKDQYFQNGVFWQSENPVSGKKTMSYVSRPGVYRFLEGIASFLDVARGTIAIRQGDSAIFSSGENAVYKNNVKIADIADVSPFKIPQWAETRPGATTQYICFNSGVELVAIDESDNVTILKDIDITTASVANPTVITTSTAHGLTTGNYIIIRGMTGSTPDLNGTRYQVTVTAPTTFTIPVNVTVQGTGGNLGNFPANTGTLQYMNGYLYTMTEDGQIYNCDIDDPLMWDPTKVITAQMYGGRWFQLARQNNFLLAFSAFTVQAFTDEANPEGSPLQNYESGVQQIGTSPLTNTMVTSGQDILWMGTTATGQNTFYKMSGLTSPKDIGTTQIKNLLSALSVRSAAYYKVGGKNLYLIFTGTGVSTTLPQILVYDIDLDLWNFWSFADSTFNFESAAFYYANENAYFLNNDGAVYQMTPRLPQDYTNSYFGASPNAVPFPFAVQTERIDFGTNERKFVNRLELIADKSSSTSNVNVSYCDDDNVTFSTARTMDTNATRPFLTQGGNFRRRRYKFSYTGAIPQRWEAFELYFRFGK